MFTTFVISLWVYLWTLHHTLPSKVILNVFLPLDHRLNATVHKKLQAWHEVDCVLRCLNDTCCRSVNYLKTLDFGKEEDDNKDNSELLHDTVVSGKNNSLLRNDDYDYFIMEKPERVSIHYSLTDTDRDRDRDRDDKKQDRGHLRERGRGNLKERQR